MLIDTHAHLDYPDFDQDRAAVIQRAKDAGVSQIISIGTRLETSRKAVQLARENSQVWAVTGCHPCEASDFVDFDWEALRALAQEERVVAIGEIGLDYHHQMPTESEQAAHVARQKELFVRQLDLAVELRLNVVIHQRDSWEDTLAVLRPYTGRVRGVFHCFGGTPEQADEVIGMGHLVSFTGIVTFKNAAQVQAAAAAIPIDTFMVETDCPFLAPHPFRGKRCEPAHARLVAEKIAALRGVRWEEIAEATTSAAFSFFKFAR